jgi:hypothetical protein
MDPGDNADRDERSRLPVAFLAGACVVLLVAAGFVLLARLTRSHTPGTEDKLPFGSAEQAYAQQIHFQSGPMSQSTNLLNQEFTYAAGTVSNDGPRTVRAIEVVFEFRDPFNQVVLRDPQRLIEPTADPLKAGQSRDFQVTLGAHLPSEWNRQYPSVHVTGLILE